MSVIINNMESNVKLGMVGDELSGRLPVSEVERIVRIVMERIKEEQDRMDKIAEETRITNKVSKPDLFD